VLRELVRNRLSGLRGRLLLPVTGRLDTLDARLGSVDARLVQLGCRLDQIELDVETTGARAAALTEQSLGFTETTSRVAQRVDEIERLLGPPAAEP
jgi:hypothetical protein